MSKKLLTALATAAGILMVAYGMIRDNDTVFVIGLIIVIGTYLVIRRRIKASFREKSSGRCE